MSPINETQKSIQSAQRHFIRKLGISHGYKELYIDWQVIGFQYHCLSLYETAFVAVVLFCNFCFLFIFSNIFSGYPISKFIPNLTKTRWEDNFLKEEQWTGILTDEIRFFCPVLCWKILWHETKGTKGNMSSSVVLGIAIVRGEENLSNESVGTCKRGSYLVVGYKDWPCCFLLSTLSISYKNT